MIFTCSIQGCIPVWTKSNSRMLLDDVWQGEMIELLGWFSSVILVLTIIKQVWKQWHEGTSKGVSIWLFIGQMTASTGFTIYSWMLNNWVFVTTNALMLLGAVAGLGIMFQHRRRSQAEQSP